MELEVVHEKSDDGCSNDRSCRSPEENSTTYLQDLDSHMGDIL